MYRNHPIIINYFTNDQSCLFGFICANDTFIAIYGVIFTIVISLGVYIYGLQNKSEKITLLKNTKIKEIIILCLLGFAFSFVYLSEAVYNFINFILLAFALTKIFKAFKEIFKFNENELSGERAVKKFKEGVIKDKLKEFKNLSKKNNALKEMLENKEYILADRFIFDESDDSYYFIRAKKSGYIVDINLESLPRIIVSEDIQQESASTSSSKDNINGKKISYYIPYSISYGAPISFDSIVLGIRKEHLSKVSEEKLESFIKIGDNYENPTVYIESETRAYYPEMFSLIKIGDAKSLELKLEEFSVFINYFLNDADAYSDLIQYINDDIIFPLQKAAFKNGDLDCIRKITAFSLGYVSKSLSNKSLQTFNIFLRNLSSAIFQSFELDKKTQEEFLDVYFRWIKELTKYYIKSKVNKDKDYVEYGVNILSSLNGSLKIALDHNDLDVFSKILAAIESSFYRENYDHGDSKDLDELILIKKSIIFGFTSWLYRRRNERNKAFLDGLFPAIEQNHINHGRLAHDKLNYLISVYLKTIKISDQNGSLGWDNWDMPEETVYTVTIRDDIKKLLADRILLLIKNNPELTINIEDGNYDQSLALIKEGAREFDPLFEKDASSFVSMSGVTPEEFLVIKNKFYEIFTAISTKYESDVRESLINQPIDEVKFNKFVDENFDMYKKSRILSRIGNFIKDTSRSTGGFGYNMLLRKEQFVDDTNVIYMDRGQFGENLAQSEDNKVLEVIYNKFDEVKDVKKTDIWKLIQKEDDVSAIVFWVSGYFDIEENSSSSFIPGWREGSSEKEKGCSYQGSINGIPVYEINKLKEFKKYHNSLFIFKSASFTVKEFEISDDQNIDIENSKITKNQDQCLSLSVTNLSASERERIKTVDGWITKNEITIQDRDKKLDELKTNVLFKFFKGLSTDDMDVDIAKIKVANIK